MSKFYCSVNISLCNCIMIYFSVGYLRCFQFTAVVDCATMRALNLISWYKYARVSKVLVSVSTLTCNKWVWIVSYHHQNLALLKFLIFANLVGVQSYPIMTFICILFLLIIYNESFYRFLVLLCLLFFFFKGNAIGVCQFFCLVICFIFCICKISLWNNILFLHMSNCFPIKF